jgi:hypothetical protein
MSRPNWAKVARECATKWMKFGPAEHFLAMKLVTQLECHDEPKPGDLAAEVDRAMRGTLSGSSNHRRATLKAAERLKEAGLLFERDGLVYVLYDEASVRKYGHLAPAVETKETVTKSARIPANDNALACARRVLGASPARTRNELSVEHHSTQLSGERERERQRPTVSGEAPPTASPPRIVCIEAERAKRAPPKPPPASPAKAKPGGRREAWQRIVGMFNERYRQRGNEGWSDVKNKGQFNLLVGSYLLPDGTLNEALVAKSLDAYFAESWWTTTPRGRTAPVGHSLHSWMLRHEEYDQRAAGRGTSEREGAYDYGF